MIYKDLIKKALFSNMETEANTLCIAQILEEDGKDVESYIPNIEAVKSKVTMKHNSTNGFDTLSELKEVGQAEAEYLLEHEKCEFWNDYFIVSIEFFKKLEETVKESSGEDKRFATVQRSMFMRKLGYHNKQALKYKGATRHLYLKEPMSNTEIREIINEYIQDVDSL